MLLGAACAWSDPKHWRDTVPKEIVKKKRTSPDSRLLIAIDFER